MKSIFKMNTLSVVKKIRNVFLLSCTCLCVSSCSYAGRILSSNTEESNDIAEELFRYTIINMDAQKYPYIIFLWIYAFGSFILFLFGSESGGGKLHIFHEFGTNKYHWIEDMTDGPSYSFDSNGGKYLISLLAMFMLFVLQIYLTIEVFNVHNALMVTIISLLFIAASYYSFQYLKKIIWIINLIIWGLVGIDFAIGLIAALANTTL